MTPYGSADENDEEEQSKQYLNCQNEKESIGYSDKLTNESPDYENEYNNMQNTFLL